MDANKLACLQTGKTGRLVVSPAAAIRFDDGTAFVSTRRGAIRLNDPRALQVLQAFAAPRHPREVFDELKPLGSGFLFSTVAALWDGDALIDADNSADVNDTAAAHAGAANLEDGEESDGDKALAVTAAEASLEHTRSIARLTRTIACDLAGFGVYVHRRDEDDGRMSIASRLSEVQHVLAGVASELREARAPYLEAQLTSLKITAASHELKLHLGSGASRLEDWVNIDVPPADLSMHLGWALPFADGSVEYIYLSHVVEHLYEEEALALLRDARRVLSASGVVRVVVPDIEKCLRAYVANDAEFFVTRRRLWPRTSRKCATTLKLVLKNAGAGIKPDSFWGHKCGYDFETLAHLLTEAGFARVERSDYMRSAHAALRIDTAARTGGFKHGDDYFSMFVEAMK
jgi:predicted SAM-dependent methyltransferase